MKKLIILLSITFLIQFKIFSQIEDWQKKSDEYNKKAQELEKDQQYESAAEMYLLVAKMELMNPNPDYQKIWVAYNFAGNSYAKINKMDKWQECYDNAKKFADKKSNLQVLNNPSNIKNKILLKEFIPSEQKEIQKLKIEAEELIKNEKYIEAFEKYAELDSLRIQYFQELYNLSLQANSNVNNEIAIKYLETAILFYEKETGDEYSIGYAKLIFNLGQLYLNYGSYEKAELLFNKDLEIRRELFKEDDPDLATSISNIGMFYSSIYRNDEAETFLKEGLEMFRRLFKEDNQNLARSITNTANFYCLKGKYTEAETLYKEALEMNRRLFKEGDHPDLASSIGNLAFFYHMVGRFAEAELLYKEALEIDKNLHKKDHPDLANSLNNMAMLYGTRGKYAEAESLIKESLEMYRRLSKEDNPGLALSISNTAMFYDRKGKYSEAQALFKEALEMDRRLFKGDDPSLVSNLNDMAKVLFKQGKYAEAEQFFRESLEMGKRLFKEYSSHLLSSIEAMSAFCDNQGRYTEAETLYLEGLNLYKKLLDNYSASLSEKERNDFLKTLLYYFEIFNSLALKWNSFDPKITCDQFNNQLITKSYLFNSNKKINQRILSSGNKELIDKYKKFKSLREQISFLSTLTMDQITKSGYNFDSLNIAANELEKDLSKKSELFATAFDKKEFTWKDVQVKLNEGEAAIEIIRFKYYNKRWTDTVYYAALIVTKETKDYPKLVLLENGNELDDKYFRLYKAEIESGIGNFPKEFDPEGNLYKAFWSKIGKELEGINKVYLSLDGVYNQINLATLRNPQTKKYLIDENEIVIVTNTKDLVTSKPYIAKSNDIVLFGFPNYKLGMQEQKLLAANIPRGEKKDVEIYGSTRDSLTKRNLSDLPQTKEEVKDIENIMKKNGWKTKTYLGDKALEEEVKNVNSPRVLHISTHGEFLSDMEIDRNEMDSRLMGMETKKYVENPLMRSMLFFAGSERTINNEETPEEGIDNGILTAYEAMNLNLDNTELVVLSACETGLGEVKNGEGVYGMQRAFQTAGARYVLMSLWGVNAKSSQELMEAFYKNWIKMGDIKKAFKEAQREIRERYPSPYHWGAFVLVGE